MVSFRRTNLATTKTHGIFVLLLMFVICTLLYYFGELADFAGWDNVRWQFLYTVHDVHRLLFLAPVVYAAYLFRVKAAIITTMLAFLIFLPRAILMSQFPDAMLRMTLFTAFAGTIGILTGITRNESERVIHLEATVRTERDKLLNMLRTVGEGIVIIGPDYRVRFTNPSMEKEFGKYNGSYCYEYLYDLMEPCPGICRLASVTAGATETWEYSFPDGRTYEVITSPFVDSDGVTCQLAAYRNISHHKQLEQELIKLDQLKTDLISNVSHELKSPLTSIKGIITSLLQKDMKLDDQTKETLLTGVSEETDRLTRLVANLLTMSRLEAGVWKPEKELYSIPEIIIGVLEHQKLAHRKHVFEADLDPELPEVYADRTQIRQLLINLLENAAAYSEEGTCVVVSARIVDSEIEIAVTDQGMGIPEEDMPKLFSKFYRGSLVRQDSGGAGLGLAICEAIIREHKGRIWVESKVGHGATFYFRLPIVQSDGG